MSTASRDKKRGRAAWPRILFGVLWSGAVMAIGLGELATDSRLNQSLEADIPLLSVTSEELADIRVNLARPEDFERAGIPRPHVLEGLQFQVKPDGQQRAIIRVTSKRPVREPFLNFLVEVTTPTVRLVREYTVLLDPVHYGQNRPEPPFKAPATPRRQPGSPPARDASGVMAPAPTAVSPSSPQAQIPHSRPSAARGEKPRPGQRYGPVQAGDSISVLGFRLRPDEEVAGAQMAWALFLANRNAFVGGDIHNLRAGVMLRVPSREAALATPYPEAMRLVRFGTGVSEHTEPAAAPAKPPPAAALPVSEMEEPDAAPEETKPESFGLRLLTADEEQGLTATPGGTQEPVPEFDHATLPRVVQELRTQVQALTVENRRLSARLAAAGQTLRALQSQAEARDEELQRLRTRLAEAAARKTAMDSSQVGLAIARDTVPVEHDSQSEDPAGGSPDDNTTWVSAAGQGLAFLALVGLLVWLMVRVQERAKRRREEFTRARGEAAETLFGEAPAKAGGTTPDGSKEAHPRQRHLPAATATDQEADRVAKAIAEAELCLAYGQFGVAESMMQQLVDSAPDAPEYRLRLLHVLHAASKRELFLDQARALRELVEDGASVTWREAAELGRELFPDEPLFQGRPGAEEANALEDTMVSGVRTDHGFSAQPGAQEQPAELAPIDTEHLDFSVVDETATAVAGSSEADTSRPLDLDIGSAETEGKTPDQADRDLTDELLAWDQTGGSSEPDPELPPSTDQGREEQIWEEFGVLSADADSPETRAGGGSGSDIENGPPTGAGHDGDREKASPEEGDGSARSAARSSAACKD